MLLLYSFFRPETWPTAADVPKKVEKNVVRNTHFQELLAYLSALSFNFPSRGLLGPSWESCWRPFGALLAPLGHLGVCLCLSGVSWALSWEPLGFLGRLLGSLGLPLCPCWAPLGLFGRPRSPRIAPDGPQSFPDRPRLPQIPPDGPHGPRLPQMGPDGPRVSQMAQIAPD